MSPSLKSLPSSGKSPGEILSDAERAVYLAVLAWEADALRPPRRFYGVNRTVLPLTMLGGLAFHLDDSRAAVGLYALPAPSVIGIDPREVEIMARSAWHSLLFTIRVLAAHPISPAVPVLLQRAA